MSTTLVSTPIKSLSQRFTKPSTPTAEKQQITPGRFRHPRLTEIVERRARVSLTSRNIQNAILNAVALVLTFILNDVVVAITTTVLSTISISTSIVDAESVLLVIRALFILNIILACRPVLPYISKTDDITDIPLTPSQRALLGLPPSAASTPGSAGIGSTGFVTPPRYRRNSGSSTANNSVSSQPSTTDRRSISANYASSPLSTSRYAVGFSPSPQQQSQSQTPVSSSRTYRRASGSLFSNSPGGASSLFHKAITQNSNLSDFDVSRASSFNSSTASGFGLSRSQTLRDRNGTADLDTSSGPATPSPTGRRVNGGAGQGGINYKWLYDKGGRLPKSDSMYF